MAPRGGVHQPQRVLRCFLRLVCADDAGALTLASSRWSVAIDRCRTGRRHSIANSMTNTHGLRSRFVHVVLRRTLLADPRGLLSTLGSSLVDDLLADLWHTVDPGKPPPVEVLVERAGPLLVCTLDLGEVIGALVVPRDEEGGPGRFFTLDRQDDGRGSFGAHVGGDAGEGFTVVDSVPFSRRELVAAALLACSSAAGLPA